MKYVIANMKMNLLSRADRERYVKNFKRELKLRSLPGVDLVLCVPSVHLDFFTQEFAKNKTIFVGVQNCFWETSGAFTGEISPEMVKNLGGSHVLVGHSERRRYFGETNTDNNKKIIALLKANITPILCIGETRDEREMGQAFTVIAEELRESLAGVSAGNSERIIFVYEPVWSAGTDKVPTSNEIMEAKLIIRKLLTEKYGAKYGARPTILYGGSVSPKITDAVSVKPGTDGVLVGRESLSPIDFLKIAEIISKN